MKMRKTWFSHTAAGVFGLGEYAAVLTASNLTSVYRTQEKRNAHPGTWICDIDVQKLN
jgi:hypothetical protein